MSTEEGAFHNDSSCRYHTMRHWTSDQNIVSGAYGDSSQGHILRELSTLDLWTMFETHNQSSLKGWIWVAEPYTCWQVYVCWTQSSPNVWLGGGGAVGGWTPEYGKTWWRWDSWGWRGTFLFILFTVDLFAGQQYPFLLSSTDTWTGNHQQSFGEGSME